uniref:Tetraspanin-7 n=1 Tax=Chrysemys picta bellii TaxID=8478 RepID=A0A8C3HKY9_CHRPI
MASPSRRLQTKPVITCLKSVLLTYSFVFWISGIILLAVGIWGKVGLEVYFSLLNEKATNVPYVLIGTGTVVILLGTFGCFATCRGSTWMLKLYAMFLSLIFLIVLVAAVVGFVFRHEIKNNFESNYSLALKNYNATMDPHSEAVDTIQRTLHCCGVQNYSDWVNTTYFAQKGIPLSCCKFQNCTDRDLKELDKAKVMVYGNGCFSLVTTVMESKMSVVAGISFGIACFQDLIPRFGIPVSINSDRGTHFTGQLVTQLCAALQIQHNLHCPHHPQSAETVKRQNGILKNKLAKNCAEINLKWPNALPLALMSMRATPNRKTGLSPHEILTGCPM